MIYISIGPKTILEAKVLRVIARTLSVCIILLSTVGCGPDFEVALPGKHLLLVMNADDAVIMSGAGEHKVDSLIQGINYNHQIIYGIVVDRKTKIFDKYFVLSVETGEVKYLYSQADWYELLEAEGVVFGRGPVLHRPTMYLATARSLRLIRGPLLVGVAVVIVLWGVVVIVRRRRQAAARLA